MPGMPNTGDTFPTAEWDEAFQQYRSNDAWYSGDQEKLRTVYGWTSTSGTANRGDDPATHYNRTDGTRRRGGVRGFLSRFFNGRIVDPSESRTRIHAPIAENIAALSADVLMSEPPAYRFVDGDGKTVKGKSQDRLDAIVNGPDHHRAQAHAAELTAGLGATVLTAHWDPSVSDRPWMQPTPCDAAIPEFVGGRLVAVNMYSMHIERTGNILMTIDDRVYVHVERHEIGAIVHALFEVKLYDATPWGWQTLAQTVPLDTIAATSHIPDIPGSVRGEVPNSVKLPTGIQRLTAAWWRNLPTKTFRRSLPFLGRADFEGVEQLLDAADEVWSSWMRDIKIARARLIVPETFLDVQGAGLGGRFDDDAEVLTPLAFTDLGGDKQPISAHQFEIRATEHSATLASLTREITRYGGYSSSSYGDDDQSGGSGGMTATEVTDRTTMTERTRDKKFGYFEEAAQPLTLALLDLDRAHYRSGVKVPDGSTLEIAIPDVSQIDPEKEARVMQYLRTAMAASTDTLVRMQHPEWDETQIIREIATIREENGIGEEPDPATEGRVDPETGLPIPPEQDPTADPSSDPGTGDENLDKADNGGQAAA